MPSLAFGEQGRWCEPALAPFRRIVPNLGGLDISPILAFMVIKLIDMLEDLDDVQNVYHNAEIPDEIMEQLG